MFKKIVMMGLAAAAVLSMSACGGESKPEENTSEVASVEDSQTEESSQPEGTEEVEPEQEEQEPEEEEEEVFYIFSEMPIAAYEVTGLKIGPDAALYEGTFTADGSEYESANYIELASGENTFILYCLPGGDYYDEGRSYSISMPTVHSPSGGSLWEAHAYTSGDEAPEYVPEGYSKISRMTGDGFASFTEETYGGSVVGFVDPWLQYIRFSEIWHPDAPQEDVIYVMDIVTQGDAYDESGILSAMVSAFEQWGASVQEISVEDALERGNIAVSEGDGE